MPAEPSDADGRLERLHDHLAATEELPVERGAGRWLGEAQAVVADLRAREADPETVRRRLGTVAELLDSFGSTGNPEADERVAAARELVAGMRSE